MHDRPVLQLVPQMFPNHGLMRLALICPFTNAVGPRCALKQLPSVTAFLPSLPYRVSTRDFNVHQQRLPPLFSTFSVLESVAFYVKCQVRARLYGSEPQRSSTPPSFHALWPVHLHERETTEQRGLFCLKSLSWHLLLSVP